MTVKAIRKKDGRLVTVKKEKTESEEKFAKGWKKIKEERGMESQEKPKERSQVLPKQPPEAASDEKKSERIKVKIPNGKDMPSSKTAKKAEPSTLLQKKLKFEDTHKRVTTYMTHTNDQKLKMIKERYGLSATKVLNHALSEYFSKLKL
ncbi:hypothetical protein [Alkalihalophilus marmarensis]|uniref:Uncharacterized protein n=1 Tax=Alkalihalophilus marmarensis DSM 21297 TaxID=1188261 RepID=U6SMD3_9BACI|nr:hypothetical protein [Alkalihalophilus marmarensis]ERN52080.1 hypothetical protein A33I_18480 [Alkalihalophilus marmarensis DSM 21297]